MLRNRPTHYDVITSRECRIAARKHYTTAQHSREKARGTDAALLYVRPHVTDLLLPTPSTGCGRPARFMLHMLISASKLPTAGRSPLLMKSTCYLPVSCELQCYASLPFAVCKYIQTVSAKPAGLDAAAARAPVMEKCNRSRVLKTGTG